MRRLLFPLLVYLPFSAAAQTAPVTTERQLIEQLALGGVQPHEVNWLEVNGLCSGLGNNRPAFTQCRLANALKQADHARARNSCARKADNLLIRRNRSSYGYTQSGDQAIASGQTDDRFQRPPTRVRRQYLDDCMLDFGFPDSENWRLQ